MKVWVVIGKYSDGPGDSGRPHCFGVFTESLRSCAEMCATENKLHSAHVVYFQINESNPGPWDPKYKTLAPEIYEVRNAP